MTVPQEYVHASRDFDRFMDDFMQIAMLETHHRSYAILRAVLHVFRDHLTVDDALRFAEILLDLPKERRHTDQLWPK